MGDVETGSPGKPVTKEEEQKQDSPPGPEPSTSQESVPAGAADQTEENPGE